MHEIFWPEAYLPGNTDNYVSNEIIVAGLRADALWPYISNPHHWPAYYANASQVVVQGGADAGLKLGTRFAFVTFGFPVEAEVTECVSPQAGKPARIAWHGWVEGDQAQRLDVHHAWLFEDLPGNRVRILTQETQIGQPARELATTRPNPMLNAHQDWIEGLVGAARNKTIA